jgi:hypothetical protein
MKTANFLFFFANRKQKFGFFGWQMVIGNRRLLFHQTWPSMGRRKVGAECDWWCEMDVGIGCENGWLQDSEWIFVR